MRKIIFILCFSFFLIGCSKEKDDILFDDISFSIYADDKEKIDNRIIKMDSNNERNYTFKFDNLNNNYWVAIYLDQQLYVTPTKANTLTYTFSTGEKSEFLQKGKRNVTVAYFEKKKNASTKFNEKNTLKQYQFSYQVEESME